ncbi:DUF1674 domain protein [Paecilomyces variotii No. 5]|uniref:Succinate dehydrogenase assembly factor 4, mitochondrial n=1 Tax=Byssochlamys spectabilis (strain No. 5 / NBRC 109023) TaxID=1356009 RepID=V5FCC1_BYSSN|nr:DUF1674 domain protein [Paecilomyces variotii No. 5]
MASFLPLPRLVAPSRQTLRSSSQPLRCLSTSSPLRADGKLNPFARPPAPPRLPKEEQEIFEELQKQSTGAFSTPRTPPKVNQSPNSAPEPEAAPSRQINASGDGEELHPNMRMGAQPEFEGERNPKTGEVGGPKTEPLRWGGGGDWSYNGRVTDF